MVRAVAAQQQIASASALSVVIRSSALCPPILYEDPIGMRKGMPRPSGPASAASERDTQTTRLLQPCTKSAHCAGAANGLFREESVPRTMKFRFSPTCPTSPTLLVSHPRTSP